VYGYRGGEGSESVSRRGFGFGGKNFTLYTDSNDSRWGFTQHHLQPFIDAYNPQNRHQRTETERFHHFTYQELTTRDKCNLDITWLRDESLQDTDNLPPPETIAAEIVENLEAALEQFKAVQEELAKKR